MKIPKNVLQEIRNSFEDGKTCTELAREYGFDRKLISYELKQLGCTIQRGYGKQTLERAKELYQQGKSISSIAKELKIDRHQLSQNFNRLGIRKTINPKNKIGKFIENDTTLYVKEQYLSGKSIAQLAKEFNKSTNFIYRIINHYEICKTNRYSRKYTFDETVFDKIDSEYKAYWLGFLMADGYICFSEVNHYSVELQLQARDRETVQAFADFIDATPPIQLQYHKSVKNAQATWRASVFSKHMCDSLTKLGCCQRKSLLLQFPRYLEEQPSLINHFMRGLFDGDGCIYVPNKKGLQPVFSIVGTYDICNQYNEMLAKYAKVNLTKIHKRNNTYTNAHGGIHQVRKIFEFLYKNATVYMERKYQKFISLYPDFAAQGTFY